MTDCCGCCIEIATPQSIYDQGEGEYPAETDIFEVIFTGTSYTYADLMKAALWATYRYYMIGSCDVERWVQSMKDRTSIIGTKWDLIFDRVNGADPVDLSDLHELSYVRTIKREPIEGTEGDVRTVSHTGDITDKNEHESLPQTATDDTKYLDSRSKDIHTNNQTDTDKYAPHTIDTEDYAEDRDINAATFSRMIREYPDILDAFAREYAQYFVQRW